jgi:hypothetical protein
MEFMRQILTLQIIIRARKIERFDIGILKIKINGQWSIMALNVHKNKINHNKKGLNFNLTKHQQYSKTNNITP